MPGRSRMSTTEAAFYFTDGTMGIGLPSYVERQADRDLFQGLLRGEFCYVLTSRQMGKSSLMVHTTQKLRHAGARAIALDLTANGQNVTPEQWYDGLLSRAGRQLQLEDELETFWKSHMGMGPAQRFFSALTEIELPRSAALLVIFIDELDVVRGLPFSTDEFFAGIRETYTRRAFEPELNRLTFCLLGVATPFELIRDPGVTPFNMGHGFRLDDFTREEAAPLAWADGSEFNIESSATRFMHRRRSAEPRSLLDPRSSISHAAPVPRGVQPFNASASCIRGRSGGRLPL